MTKTHNLLRNPRIITRPSTRPGWKSLPVEGSGPRQRLSRIGRWSVGLVMFTAGYFAIRFLVGAS